MEREKVLALLQEFPWLWALRKIWYDDPVVRIRRPDRRFFLKNILDWRVERALGDARPRGWSMRPGGPMRNRRLALLMVGVAFGAAGATALGVEPDSLWDVQALKAAAPHRQWDDPTLSGLVSLGLWSAAKPDLYVSATAGLGRAATAGNNLFCVVTQELAAGEQPSQEGVGGQALEREPRPRCLDLEVSARKQAWNARRRYV